MGVNDNSLVNKFESLGNELFVEKPPVMFLQETKLGRPHKTKTLSGRNTQGMNFMEQKIPKRLSRVVEFQSEFLMA